MKPLVILFSFAIVIGLGSCSKQYTCECVTNDGYVTTSEISEGSREDSEAACEDMEYTHTSTLNNQTFVSTNTCELK